MTECAEKPSDCIQGAVEMVQRAVFLDDEVRNQFIECLQPYVTFYVRRRIERYVMPFEPEDYEDLLSTVNTYLVEKWFPKLDLRHVKTDVRRIHNYLRTTMDGIIKNFLADYLSEPQKEPFTHESLGEARFIPGLDFDMDKVTLKDEIIRRVKSYTRMRGRGAEIQDVISRLVRLEIWKKYRANGRLA